MPMKASTSVIAAQPIEGGARGLEAASHDLSPTLGHWFASHDAHQAVQRAGSGEHTRPSMEWLWWSTNC